MTPITLLDFTDPLAAGGADAPRLRCAFGAPREVLSAATLAQVPAVLEQVQAAAESGAWCVGMLSYEAAAAFDSALHTLSPDAAFATPLAWFAVHDAPLQWPDPAQASPVTGPGLVWTSEFTRDRFDAALGRMADDIAAGAYYQANFTAPLTAALPEPLDSPRARALFDRLQAAQPGGYAALLPVQDAWVVSVSPELFFDWDSASRSILARPMKGTAARGATPEADAQAAAALRASDKERAENVMVVDLLRNDLSRIAEPGSVQVPRLFHAEALPTVWQMTSDVRAMTRAKTGLVDVFRALFPCGSVTGAPKAAAMHALTDLEIAPRGVYCGALGVVRPGAARPGKKSGIRATFNVPIRTLEVRGAMARCGIGSGITSGSQPQAEWREWQAKRAFLERAGASFEVLETLALIDGGFQYADLHLARMAASAEHFGFAWNAHAVRGELQITALQHLSGRWRVRLLLAAGGALRVEAFEQHDVTEPLRLQLAQHPIAEAHGEFVLHKTTHRAHYDAFRPQDPGVFDTILYNEEGEITECTRGNIAALVNGQWITPPLRCGLLSGVGRALAVADGRLQEAVLPLDDVGQVTAWAFVNSLRGWVEAELVAPSGPQAQPSADQAKKNADHHENH